MRPRSAGQRKLDAIAKLEAENADAWVATASPDGVPHLVPLSLAWDGEHVILATEGGSATARNLSSSGRARLALGSTRDVVIIDAELGSAVPVADAPARLADRYAAQADWEPRDAGPDGGFVYLLLAPTRVQVWREEDEIAGRTIMRRGRWLV